MATDLNRLINQLNTSPTAKSDQALWQVILQMIKKFKELETTVASSSGTTSDVVDHVVMSDGVTPIPSPVNDGFGNFIYIEYVP